MSRTDGVRATGTRETDHPEGSNEGTETVRGWVRDLVRASGGGAPSRAALYSNDASLGMDEVAATSGLSDDEVRRAVASALPGARPDTVDDVRSALSEVVGNVVRHEVSRTAERALGSRLGELRRAAHDDAKLARVLGRVGDDPDPASRELQLAALGATDPRAAAALLHRTDVRNALAAGSLPPETAAIVLAVRDRGNRERVEEMFSSALGAAARDPFLFGAARDRLRLSLGPSGSFVRRAVSEARGDDGAGRTVNWFVRTGSDLAASIAGGGPIGSAFFGAASGSVARSQAGAQLAGLLCGASTLSDARQAAATSTSAWIAAGVGIMAGSTLESLLPQTWVGRVAGAVAETTLSIGTDQAARKLILRP